MVINSDGINQYIRLFHCGLDFAFGVAAVVVASVGNDEQRLLLILGLPHFADAQINRIQQRRSAFRNRIDELAL